ncbi:MAG: hypothetical protein ACT452_16745 [Microthrixaceae bacterium]
MSHRLALRVVGLTMVMALVANGCSRRETFEEEVRAAADLAKRSASAFVYTDLRADRQIRVQGVVEDDFRYKAAVSIDNKPAYEQVVLDDTLAVRFIDASQLRSVLAVNVTEADLTTDLEGVSALDVLRTGRWLVDDDGAPLVSAVTTNVAKLGKDPVLDATTALEYVAVASDNAVAVERWSDDSLDPTYPTSEDIFPTPADGSGVTRYDLRRPDLPAVNETSGDVGGIPLPSVTHFRKMAIYVKSGRIIEVREEIDATGKKLDQFLDYARSFIKAFAFDDAYKKQFNEAVAAAKTDAALADLLFAGVNTALVSLGQDPITRRTMTLSLPDNGAASVALPSENVITGSLALLATSAAGQAASVAADTAGSETDLTNGDGSEGPGEGDGSGSGGVGGTVGGSTVPAVEPNEGSDTG